MFATAVSGVVSCGVESGQVVIERGEAGLVVVALTGEHDLHTAPGLRAHLDDAIDAKRGVVVDLSRAEFVDSSILGAILESRRVAHGAGLGFSVVLDGGGGPVRRVLEVTGLRGSLPVHETRADAIEEARGGPPDATGG